MSNHRENLARHGIEVVVEGVEPADVRRTIDTSPVASHIERHVGQALAINREIMLAVKVEGLGVEAAAVLLDDPG